MKILDESLLYKASIEVLEQLKNDADDSLKSWHETESIISQKANSMLQFLVPLAIGLFGFSFDKLSNNSIDIMLFASLFELFVLIISVYFVYNVINLKKSALNGVTPSEILSDDVVNDYVHYVRLRVFGMQKAIECNMEVHKQRIIYYKKSLNVLTIGTLIVFIVFSVLTIL
jgi:hypothetical protein